jgi:hypothetical protein
MVWLRKDERIWGRGYKDLLVEGGLVVTPETGKCTKLNVSVLSDAIKEL